MVRPGGGIAKERKGWKDCGGSELGLGCVWVLRFPRSGHGGKRRSRRRRTQRHHQGTLASCAGPQISAVEGPKEGFARQWQRWHRDGPGQGGSASTLLPLILPPPPPLPWADGVWLARWLARWLALVDPAPGSGRIEIANFVSPKKGQRCWPLGGVFSGTGGVVSSTRPITPPRPCFCGRPFAAAPAVRPVRACSPCKQLQGRPAAKMQEDAGTVTKSRWR